MTPYVLGLLWAYLLFLWAERGPPSRRGYLLLGGLALPLALALFRYSGTDTYAYEHSLWSSFSQGVPTGFEPGFDLLARGLMALTGSEVLTVRLLALAFTGLLALFLWRADPVERYFLFLFFIPAFFYQYSMNAVRAGLALALVLLAWQGLRRGKWGVALGFGGLAPAFHYSAFVILLPLVLLEALRLRPALALGVAVASTLPLSLLLLVEWEYFLSKLLLYLPQILGTLQAMGEAQGLPGGSRTLMMGMLILGLLASPVHWGKKLVGGGLLLLLAGGSQALAMVSMAGLRLLELASFVAPLAAIRLHDLDGRAVQRGFVLLMALAGLLGGVFFFRQQARDWGGRFTGSPTPFFPYQTVFRFNPCPPSFYYPKASPRNCPFLEGDGFFERPPSLHPPLPR